MPEKPISREYRIYLALWRKALNSIEPIEIKCSSLKMAVAMRQGMYRAIRPFRNGLMNDEELRTSAEKFVVYLQPKDDREGEHILEFRPRLTLRELEGIWTDLGIDEEDLLLGDERSAREHLKEFLEPDAAAKPRVTPFYQRGS
jgi:hypothetical protein